MHIRYIHLFLLGIAIVFFLPQLSQAGFDTDPFLDQRVKLDAPPIDSINEHIDPYSGNMLIVQTDLHMPGNGGLDLDVMRTYNSIIWNRRDVSSPTNLALSDNSFLGIGWTMHMGILRNPDLNGTTWGGNPILELPDGTKQIFFQDKNDPTRLISKDFWTLKTITGQTGYEVRSPEGIIYTINYSTVSPYAGYMTTTGTKVAQVTKIQNPAKTAAINITYKMVGANFSYIQTITDSVGRVVTFNYDTHSPTNRLTSIVTDNRTISYAYNQLDANIFLLSTVTPPVGNNWQYSYETSAYEMTGITYPSGGQNTYTYGDVLFYTGEGCSIKFRVVTQKTTSGRNIPNGTWTYTYNSGGVPNTTVINGPNNVTETYKFYGWGNGSIASGNVWTVGLPISKAYNFGGSTLTEAYTWAKGTAVSAVAVSNINWGCSGTYISDTATYSPFFASKTITRDGKTYTAANSNFNTYGDPQTVSESGDANRTQTLTYCTNTSLNIVKGRPLSESVTGSSFSGTSATTWTYGASNDCINPTKIVKDGVTKNFAYDTNGNLSSITDANNHTTIYLWSNGRISKATNPIYFISRFINTDGTIKSETNGRGYTTSYAYDKNLRLTGITPPVGNATSFSYPADSSTRTQTRGGYTITHSFDGFARPTGSSDSKGVTTTIVYKAYGVKDYADSNIGDKTSYDFFGRPTQVLDKDNYSESYNYAAVSGTTTVTVTDKNSKTSTLSYTSFGDPDEKYLMAVKDQAGVTTSYSRNILGNVTGITQGGISHSYTYDPTKKAFLISETHPESGTTSYGRDNVGNMTSRTDATGTKNYGYDAIDRLTSITSGSSSISLGYDNANNRTSLTSPAATLGFGYDTANRLTSKSETIAGVVYSTAYGYDNNDNITSITYPSTRVVNYGYNGNNQVTSITGFVNTVSYNTSGVHAGLPSSFVYPNGLTTTLSYNNRNLTTGISAGSAASLTYGYDSRGNTTAITNNLSSAKNQILGYDNLSRITSFSGAWGSGTYGYDNYGNRTGKTVGGSSSSYTYSSNRLSSASGSEAASYNYANGNGALTGGTWGGNSYTLGYDAFDNLASYSSGSTTLASFSYDGDGTRVAKTSNGKTIVYHYNPAGQTASENYGDGRFIADYVYLNGKLVARAAATPVVSATPTSDSFGKAYVGTISASHSFTISNVGTADLAVTSISLTGSNPGEYLIVSDACSGQSIAPSATCVVQAAFTPTSPGAKVANISIISNDPLNPTFPVSLNGTATYPVLSVAKSGIGTGSVTGSGITCGTTCSAAYTVGTQVALTAAADTCSTFAGWSGACSGTGDCVVTLNADTAVTATFNKTPPTADFSVTPTTGSAPILVVFSPQVQCATVWSWSFGDGTTSNQSSPSHTYKMPGTYTVSLTASNEAGSITVPKTNYLAFATCPSQPVRILGKGDFATLQAAYDAAADGDAIMGQAQDIAGDVTTNRPISVTVDGGYDCTYATKADNTGLKGTLTIQNGTVTVKDVHVNQ